MQLMFLIFAFLTCVGCKLRESNLFFSWYACLYMYKVSAFIIYYEMKYKLVKKMVALIRLPGDD